jgi:TDG/mug DNA glycosylase family protein
MSTLPRFGSLAPDCVPDLLAHNLDVVFCGTALGRVSAQARAYYANPGNFFWKALHATGLTPTLVKPADYPQVLQYGIGLTDLCKNAYGQDSELPEDAFDYDALRTKIEEYQPRFLAFTSKTGAAGFLGHFTTGALKYGEQPERVGDTRVFVLPSPSGQARTYWSIHPWQELADKIKE